MEVECAQIGVKDSALLMRQAILSEGHPVQKTDAHAQELGYYTHRAQSGVIRMTWARSLVIIFRSQGSNGIGQKAYRSPQVPF